MAISTHHVFKAEVVVDEEHVAPPVLFADVGVVRDHKVPERAGTEPGQHKSAEQDERAEGRHDPEKPRRVLLGYVDPVRLLQPTEQGVRAQGAREHYEGVRVQTGGPTQHRPRLPQQLEKQNRKFWITNFR